MAYAFFHALLVIFCYPLLHKSFDLNHPSGLYERLMEKQLANSIWLFLWFFVVYGYLRLFVEGVTTEEVIGVFFIIAMMVLQPEVGVVFVVIMLLFNQVWFFWFAALGCLYAAVYIFLSALLTEISLSDE